MKWNARGPVCQKCPLVSQGAKGGWAVSVLVIRHHWKVMRDRKEAEATTARIYETTFSLKNKQTHKHCYQIWNILAVWRLALSIYFTPSCRSWPWYSLRVIRQHLSIWGSLERYRPASANQNKRRWKLKLTFIKYPLWARNSIGILIVFFALILLML